jgi:hypothetical protein
MQVDMQDKQTGGGGVVSRAPESAKGDEGPDQRRQEMLVVMTALSYIEAHELLGEQQLKDARRSLQALFIRTTGEETMLRKLIDILRVNRDVQAAFGEIGRITDGVSTSCEALSRRVQDFRTALVAFHPTPEENRDFVAPLIGYAQRFLDKVLQFDRMMSLYLHLREEQARRVHEFRVAREASDRLRERLAEIPRGLGGTRSVDAMMRQDLLDSFDFGGAEADLERARRDAVAMGERIAALLRDLRALAELAVPPDARSLANFSGAPVSSADDVYHRFAIGMRRHERVRDLRDTVLEHFRLFHRSHSVFAGDFERLVKAAEAISRNPKDYFDAKLEDYDLRAKRQKLSRLEGLLPFLEHAARLVRRAGDEPAARFSAMLSDLIGVRPSGWSHVAGELLAAKVRAEADMQARMGGA